MNPWLVGFVLISILVLFIVALVKSSRFRIWLGGAFSAFISGFIEGAPAGSTGGGLVAAADGQVFADFRGRHLLIEFAHLAAVPFLTGLADVRTFQKSNPFPNLFAPAPAQPAVQAGPALNPP
jgi:hypothetical protein